MKILKPTKLFNKVYDISEDTEYIIFVDKSSSAKFDFKILKENIDLNINVVILLKGSEQVSLEIKTSHLVPSSMSRVTVRSVLMDYAELNFNGMIYIAKGAHFSDAYLQNDNLVVGDNSIINSSPQLEILADDVKASHGVTITSFNDDEMFYSKTRGLDDETIKDLIIRGFISELLTGVKISALKEYNFA